MLPAQMLVCGDQNACFAVDHLVDKLPGSQCTHLEHASPAFLVPQQAMSGGGWS